VKRSVRRDKRQWIDELAQKVEAAEKRREEKRREEKRLKRTLQYNQTAMQERT
jgi:hypothetical protein